MINFKPLILSLLCFCLSNVKAQVSVSSGTNIVIGSGANFLLNDLSLQYGNSSIVTNGNLIFSGNADNFISGTTTISKLTLSKANGKKLSLSKDFSLSGTLTLNSGILDLNGNNLNLGSTGILQNESANAYVTGTTGYIISNANLNMPQAISPGNIGLTVTGNTNWGNTVFKRSNYAVSNGSKQTIKRFYEVVPTNNTNLNATVRFNYLDGELNGIQETDLKLIFSDNNGLSWTNLNGNNDATQNYIEASNVTAMGRFSASDFVTLPISSIKLSGKASQELVNISWNTINEVNVAHFILEKSTNGIIFTTLANVASNSATSKDNTYSSMDKKPNVGTNYYRVRGIDRDGKETISAILPVNFSLSVQQELTVFPNPSTKLIKVQFNAINLQPITLSVISSLGKTELSQIIQPQIGLNEIPLDITTLASGVYYIKVSGTTFNKSTKFIKK